MKIKLLTVKDMRSKKPAELSQNIADLEAKYRELTHSLSLNKEKTTHQLKALKRSIAQIKTVQSQAEKEEEK